jgi:hypothetical protein
MGRCLQPRVDDPRGGVGDPGEAGFANRRFAIVQMIQMQCGGQPMARRRLAPCRFAPRTHRKGLLRRNLGNIARPWPARPSGEEAPSVNAGRFKGPRSAGLALRLRRALALGRKGPSRNRKWAPSAGLG